MWRSGVVFFEKNKGLFVFRVEADGESRATEVLPKSAACEAIFLRAAVVEHRLCPREVSVAFSVLALLADPDVASATVVGFGVFILSILRSFVC